MSELARRRSARDLWISRSHLWGAGAAALLLAVVAFSMGVVIGGGERAHAAPVDPLRLGEAPDDQLVELLARVEASADPTSGMASLTFPDVLAGAEPGAFRATDPERRAGGAATVRAAPGQSAPVADTVPPGRYTLVVRTTTDAAAAIALRDQLAARELPAWVATERVRGSAVWQVRLGGFATEAEARVASERFAAAADDLPLVRSAEVAPIGEIHGG